MFLGDVRTQVPSVQTWEEGFVFTPATPGYLHYGEAALPAEGNAHGLHPEFYSAFDRFFIYRERDRFLEAEEVAVACMESRSIIMDDVTISIDGSGYDEVGALFNTTDWTDPASGRMWDSNHRGHYLRCGPKLPNGLYHIRRPEPCCYRGDLFCEAP